MQTQSVTWSFTTYSSYQCLFTGGVNSQHLTNQQWFCVHQLGPDFMCLLYLRHSWCRLLYCLGWDSPVCEPCCCAWLWGSAAASCSGGCTRTRCFSPTGQIVRGSAGRHPQRRLCSPCQTAPPSTAGQRQSRCQLSWDVSPGDKYPVPTQAAVRHFMVEKRVNTCVDWEL